VIRETSRGRYILNTMFSAWLDKRGAPLYPEGSEALAKLDQMIQLHPRWKGKNEWKAGAKPPGNLGEQPEQRGPTPPNPEPKRGPTPPEKGAYTPNERGPTPPKKGAYTPNESPQTHENAASPPGAEAERAEREVRTAADAFSPELELFASRFCLLSPAEIQDARQIAAALTNPAAMIGALERLAAAKDRPENPGGWLRSVAEALDAGAPLRLPPNAQRFAEFQRAQAARERMRHALAGSDPKAAAAAAKAAGFEHTAKAANLFAQRDARRDELAGAFRERPGSQQVGAVDELRRAKMPATLVHDLNRWIERGRPDPASVADPLEARQLLAAMAAAEEVVRKYLDPVIATTAVTAPDSGGRREAAGTPEPETQNPKPEPA
jgi:hypothetical protein